MLGIMRKYKESIMIKLVFGLIVFSFIGTIFLVWGKGGDTGRGGSLNYAAKVNGTKISTDEYTKSYYRLRGIYEQIYGRSLSPEMEKQMAIKKQALDNLVENVLVLHEAKKMGLDVSKDEVASAVAAVPAFQKDGVFDFQQYLQVLKSNRITPQDFEGSQKEELLAKKARKSIQDKATVSDAEAQTYFHKKNDQIGLSYTTVAPADVVAEVKLSEQELNSYLQSHQEQFKTPEQISLQFVLFDPASVSAKVAVSDEEIQSHYQKNIDRYQGKGGILPLTEVKDRVRADALKAKASKQAYELAADAINKNLAAGNLQAVASALGVKISETALFTAAQPPAQLQGETAVVKKAFLLKGTELGGPIETAKGIYAVKIKERKPATVPPLAQIKGQVEAMAKQDKARELAKKKAEELLATLAKGGTGGKMQETGSFSYNEQGLLPGIGQSAEAMEAAFALTSAAPFPKAPFKVGERWVVFKLKNRTAAADADFQKTKEQVKQTMLPKKQQDALASWLKELKAKAKIEINKGLLAD
jgi:peptidyl-prolyl cis-trans isomerase D